LNNKGLLKGGGGVGDGGRGWGAGMGKQRKYNIT